MAFPHHKGRGSSGHGVALFSGSVVAESANATNLQITTQPGLSGASPYTLSPQPVVTAKKSLGTTDSAYVTNVVASLNVLSGSPVLSGTTTKTPVSGVATFTDLVVTGAGTWTITFTSGTLASAVSSTGTTTSSSAATKLTITTAPGLSGSTPYTLSPQPVVAAQNGSSVTDTGYVSNVVAALNVLTGSPVLSGTTTKACVSGVATFTDLVVTGAGTWTITFTSGSLTSATSSTGTTTSGGSTVVTAHFTGANGTAINAYTDDTSKAWVAGTNGSSTTSLQIQSNQFTSFNDASGGGHKTALVDSGVSDCTVSAKWIAGTRPAGLIVRGGVLNSGDGFLFLADGTTAYLYSYAGFTPTLVNSVAQAVVANDVLSVVLSGTSIVCKLNGSAVSGLSTTSATGQTNTRHGLIVLENGTYGSTFDDFSVTVP